MLSPLLSTVSAPPISASRAMAESRINEAKHQRLHADVPHVVDQLEKKLAALVLENAGLVARWVT